MFHRDLQINYAHSLISGLSFYVGIMHSSLARYYSLEQIVFIKNYIARCHKMSLKIYSKSNQVSWIIVLTSLTLQSLTWFTPVYFDSL